MKYDCLPNRGCGYDDDCGLQETCVNLYPRGHRCEGIYLFWIKHPSRMSYPLENQKMPVSVFKTRLTAIFSNYFFAIVLSWADVPNWPIMPTNQELNSDDQNDPTSRSDSVPDNLVDPGNLLISRNFVVEVISLNDVILLFL